MHGCRLGAGGEAQTFAVLHNFTGAADGGYPAAGLTLDRAGNLYGTTYDGSGIGYGKIFKLSNSGGGWVFTPLYSFSGGTDGANPIARVISFARHASPDAESEPYGT